MPHNLLRDVERGETHDPTCALCGCEDYAAQRYLEGVGNDGVNSVPLRQRLERLGGYCPEHCARFAAMSHLLSSAILFEDFLRMRLERARSGRGPLDIRCEACVVEASTRDTLARSIKRHRHDEALQERLLHTPLCLTHLELVCRALPKGVREALVERHHALQTRLGEVIRKHDYRFVGEGMTPEEVGSVKEVLRLLGAKEE